jgi:hypothetical protein
LGESSLTTHSLSGMNVTVVTELRQARSAMNLTLFNIAAILLIGQAGNPGQFESGLQVGEHCDCLEVIWLVNWPHEGSFKGCMHDALSGQSPIAIVFTRTVDERVAELVLALDLQVTSFDLMEGPMAFVCGVGGLEHEHLAPLKSAAQDVPLVIPGRRKVDQELLEKYNLNDEAAVTVIVYDEESKVIANYAFANTDELTRDKVKEVVRALNGRTAE